MLKSNYQEINSEYKHLKIELHGITYDTKNKFLKEHLDNL